MKHKLLVNILVPLWLLTYTIVSIAASATLAQQMRDYDIESFLWSGAAGLLGGAFRTILTLASDKRLVLDILKESIKDMVVALVAGFIAYLIVLGASALMVTYLNMSEVPRDLRLLILVGAGWTRLGFFKGLDRITASGVDRLDRGIKEFRGKAPAETAPSSIAAPLGDK